MEAGWGRSTGGQRKGELLSSEKRNVEPGSVQRAVRAEQLLTLLHQLLQRHAVLHWI